MESTGFNPASECIVLACWWQPRAALLEGTERTLFFKKKELQDRHDDLLQNSGLAAAATTDDGDAWHAEVAR